MESAASRARRGDVLGRLLEVQAKPCGEAADEAGVTRGSTATQAVIDVANNQPAVAQVMQVVQQGDRIATTGDADQVAAGGREGGEVKLHGAQHGRGASPRPAGAERAEDDVFASIGAGTATVVFHAGIDARAITDLPNEFRHRTKLRLRCFLAPGHFGGTKARAWAKEGRCHEAGGRGD